MRRRDKLQCCLGCGRDTHGLYCHQCGGHNESAGQGRGYPSTKVADMPLEDDYSEESNANSVCQDNSVSVGGR